MADPAVEAARRRRRRALVYRGVPDEEIAAGCEGATGDEIAAAREALAPVREIHRPVVKHFHGLLGARTVCEHCYHPAAFGVAGLWPCDTALTCYTTEELSDEQ